MLKSVQGECTFHPFFSQIFNKKGATSELNFYEKLEAEWPEVHSPSTPLFKLADT